MDKPTEHTGERIRRARQGRGMNKNQLARALSTSWQHLDNWEKGKVEPSLSSIRKLAEILEVSADFLLGLRDAPDRRASVDEFLSDLAPADLTPEEERWLRQAPVDHALLAAKDYADLLDNLRQPASRSAKSGPRPKIDRQAMADKLRKVD